MVLAALALVSFQSSVLPNGKAKISVDAPLPIEVFTYKPSNYRGDRLFVVFHGTDRNADEYRDHSVELAEKFGALVIAPKFDAARFPSWRYHRGGILDGKGLSNIRQNWTYPMIPKIIDAVRAREGKPQMPYWLMGHSAGGQFLNRMAAFYDSGARGIIASNPGSLIFPDPAAKFAYGFGGLVPSISNDEAMKAYLAQPLTLYVGTADNKPDDWFDTSPEAMRQGGGRFQRSQNCYAMAKALAEKNSWRFNWRIVTAEGIGHDHEKMFNHPAMAEALGIR